MIMSSEKPKVSIIILNWNGLDDTIECLESLKKITYPNYEVILVDNASEGNDVDVLKEKFGDYIYIMENDKNYGFAEGNNIAMRFALANSNPAYIFLLNNDTTVDPEFLSELVDTAESDATIGAVGPKILAYYKPDVVQSCGAKFNLWVGGYRWKQEHKTASGQNKEIIEVDHVMGAAMLARASVLEGVGLFDPIFFANWEETDWCMRVKEKGYKVIYNPEAKVWHKMCGSLPFHDTKRVYLILRNNIIFMRKHGKIVHFPSFFAYYFLLRVPVWCLGIFRYGSVRNPLKIATMVLRAVRDGLTTQISRV